MRFMLGDSGIYLGKREEGQTSLTAVLLGALGFVVLAVAFVGIIVLLSNRG